MSNKTLEQSIRLVMEQQANAGVLEYGSDIARDTYSKDTPGQTPGIDHSPEQHQHKPNLALDGVPEVGGTLKKPNFEKDAGMGKVAEAKDMKVKNCGCGKDPCETYGSKEEQMKEAFTPIGKSREHEVHHTDSSDYNFKSKHASKVSHGGKGSDEAGEDQQHYKFKDHKIDVNDNHTKTKLSHIQQRVKASGVSPKHHDAVSKTIHKHITMEGVMKMYELKISTMQKYKQAASSDVQDGENARHKGYPEKDIDKRQDKRYKGIDTANKRIDKKQVKMAKGVAFDKRYKGGNMTGASKAIDKIKPGLSDHPKVKSALRRANEEIGE